MSISPEIQLFSPAYRVTASLSLHDVGLLIAGIDSERASEMETIAYWKERADGSISEGEKQRFIRYAANHMKTVTKLNDLRQRLNAL